VRPVLDLLQLALDDADQAVQVGGGEAGHGPLEQRPDALRGIKVRRVRGQPVDPQPCLSGCRRSRSGMLVIQVTRDSSASSGRPKRTACEILEVLFSQIRTSADRRTRPCTYTACGRAAPCRRYRRCSRARPWPLAERPDLIPCTASGDPDHEANTPNRYQAETYADQDRRAADRLVALARISRSAVPYMATRRSTGSAMTIGSGSGGRPEASVR
jgi:hypothetical protein